MLLSVGHGRFGREELTTMLRAADTDAVVDIRRYPGSRRNPDLGSEMLAHFLPDAGIGYRWEPRLGGRRRLPPGAPREDPWWSVDSFAAYAAHTRTPEFAAALTELLDQVARQTTVMMMCSESVWWRCHRRLVADVAVLSRGVSVEHLMHDGRRTPHVPAEGARVRADGQVVWDRPRARA